MIADEVSTQYTLVGKSLTPFPKNEHETLLHAFQMNLSALCCGPMCLIAFDTRIIVRRYYSWASHELGRHMQFAAEVLPVRLTCFSFPFAMC